MNPQLPIDVIILVLDFLHPYEKYKSIVYSNISDYFDDDSEWFWVACVEFERYDLLESIPFGFGRYMETATLSNLYFPAVKSGNTEMVKFLKRKKIGYLNSFIASVACLYGQLETLKILRSYSCTFNRHGYFYAFSNRHYHVCEYLADMIKEGQITMAYMSSPFFPTKQSDIRNIIDLV
jgi:hypothetical protein